MASLLFGHKVGRIEKRLGRPLEAVLKDMERRGDPTYYQAHVLGVSRQMVRSWRRALGMPPRPAGRRKKHDKTAA